VIFAIPVVDPRTPGRGYERKPTATNDWLHSQYVSSNDEMKASQHVLCDIHLSPLRL